jgi:hypothetical protein
MCVCSSKSYNSQSSFNYEPRIQRRWWRCYTKSHFRRGPLAKTTPVCLLPLVASQREINIKMDLHQHAPWFASALAMRDGVFGGERALLFAPSIIAARHQSEPRVAPTAHLLDALPN